MTSGVRQRASALCVNEDKALLVGLRDPHGATLWFPPGGAIEPGEKPLAAAEREAREESGFSLRCVEPGEVLSYVFHWGNAAVRCETAFFAATLVGNEPPSPPIDPLVVAVEWISVDRLAAQLTYADPLRSFLLRRYAELARSRKLNR